MEDRLFPILLRIEPSVKELTKEDYEKRMGFKPEGGEGKKDKDVGQPVGADPEKKDEAPVRADRTRPEALKALREKGYAYKDLKSKTRAELNAML